MCVCVQYHVNKWRVQIRFVVSVTNVGQTWHNVKYLMTQIENSPATESGTTQVTAKVKHFASSSCQNFKTELKQRKGPNLH